MNKLKKILLLLLIAFLVSGISQLKINYPLQRIVSLAPNVTEMICLLGAENALVGITNECDYPLSIREKESTGPFGNPDLEKIIALKPDIVLYTDIKDLNFQRKMYEFGIPAVQFRIDSFGDLQHKMLQLGEMLGKKMRAKEVVAEWEAQLRRMQVEAKYKKKIRVFFEIWPKPLITVGKQSYLDQMIILAGGENIAGHLDTAYPKPPVEFVIGADPELIFLGYEVSENATYPKIWQEVTAVKKDLIIHDIDLDLMLRPGPRLFKGLKIMQRKIDEARKILYE